MTNMFGFSTEPSAGGGDFTPICKYDARAGRFFRVDRVQTADGYQSDQVDITPIFKAIFDFENLETGWIDFPVGSAPSFAFVKLTDMLAGKARMPDKPTPKHKNGIRVLVKLAKACGGDKPIREIAGTAKVFVNGIEEVFGQYQAEKAKFPGKLPALVLQSTMPVKSGSGSQVSTNYRPIFRIDGWAARPEDLVHVARESAPVSPLEPTPMPWPTTTPPSTGSQTVPPPSAMASVDDDFG